MSNQNATAPLPVVVFADFICPYSYIALDQADDLIRDYNVELLWRPHWLHPEVPPTGAPMPTETAVVDRRAETLAWLMEMAPERAARMRFPNRIQFSLFAFEALEFTQDHRLALPFKTAVFESLWIEGLDIAKFRRSRRLPKKSVWIVRNSAVYFRRNATGSAFTTLCNWRATLGSPKLRPSFWAVTALPDGTTTRCFRP